MTTRWLHCHGCGRFIWMFNRICGHCGFLQATDRKDAVERTNSIGMREACCLDCGERS